MKRKVNHYTDEFKLKVAQEYLSTDQSIKEIMQKYGIRGNNCISGWMLKFDLRSPTERQIKLQREMSREKQKTTRELELESNIRKLEEALEHERLRTLALNKIIDIAELNFKISIRKKSGTKQ